MDLYFLGLVTRNILCSFGDVMFSCFFVSCSLLFVYMLSKEHSPFPSFLCSGPWFLCSTGLLQLLHCPLKFSQSYFHLWVVVKSLFCGVPVLQSPAGLSCSHYSKTNEYFWRQIKVVSVDGKEIKAFKGLISFMIKIKLRPL